MMNQKHIGHSAVIAITSIVVALFSGFEIEARTYHVAAGGNDHHSGSETEPLRSVQKAADLARAGDTVLLRGIDIGAYELPVRKSAAPYPPSPVIQSLAWAPKETIRRAARGSDRFPITWADDDALYTAWGDGKGFGNLEKKLNLGYARVTGPPEAFSAEDIRSPTGEDTGDGRRGFKASGLLSLAGTLYLWVGNADKNGRQSQLAWSADRGRTWTWAGWRFAEFGYLSLVQPMGCGPGRDRQFPGQVDRRRWPQVMAGFFRR